MINNAGGVLIITEKLIMYWTVMYFTNKRAKGIGASAGKYYKYTLEKSLAIRNPSHKIWDRIGLGIVKPTAG